MKPSVASVYVGLGANINPETALLAGIEAIASQFSNLQLSPVYRTEAIGISGPDFLNMVVSFDCFFSLTELRHWIKDIETLHGRARNHSHLATSHIHASHGSHTLPDINHGLDIDILLFGGFIDSKQNIPHQDIWQRAYVLHPLSELAPTLQCPSINQTISELWRTSQLQQRIEKVTIPSIELLQSKS